MTEAVDNTTLIVIIVAALAAAILAFLLRRRASRARGRERILSERAGDERPYFRPPASGVTDEVATATADVLRDVLSVDAEGAGTADDLQALKGVGPKLAARLNELGITSYAHLAGLGANEVAMLDDRLGPFKGRVAKDRLVEQAQYLARGDTDGFEARFGRLGGEG